MYVGKGDCAEEKGDEVWQVGRLQMYNGFAKGVRGWRGRVKGKKISERFER